MKLTLRERFLAKVCADSARGCWLWQGMVTPDGYGVAFIAGKRLAAHRASWVLFCSEIPPGMSVCHKCDVRACVNPEHLFVGTAADNNLDRVNKGRTLRGERHHATRLTASQVSRIKAMLLEDRMYMSEIAREFGVSISTIAGIKAGRTWRHIEAELTSAASVIPEVEDEPQSSI